MIKFDSITSIKCGSVCNSLWALNFQRISNIAVRSCRIGKHEHANGRIQHGIGTKRGRKGLDFTQEAFFASNQRFLYLVENAYLNLLARPPRIENERMIITISLTSHQSTNGNSLRKCKTFLLFCLLNNVNGLYKICNQNQSMSL